MCNISTGIAYPHSNINIVKHSFILNYILKVNYVKIDIILTSSGVALHRNTHTHKYYILQDNYEFQPINTFYNSI